MSFRNTANLRHDAGVSDEEFYSIVRMRIRKARNNLGLTQSEVAERVGVELRHYQRYETHKCTTSSMSLTTLRQISKVFKINLEDLVCKPSADEIKSLKR